MQVRRFGLVILATLTIGCTSRTHNLHSLDLSYGTKTYGQVEVVGSDYVVVRFLKIEAIGYALENPTREMNLVRLFHRDDAGDYFVGEKIEARVLGGDRRKDPLDYEINYIETAPESELAFRRLRHEPR